MFLVFFMFPHYAKTLKPQQNFATYKQWNEKIADAAFVEYIYAIDIFPPICQRGRPIQTIPRTKNLSRDHRPLVPPRVCHRVPHGQKISGLFQTAHTDRAEHETATSHVNFPIPAGRPTTSSVV